jgi:general secretion pathway protein C
MLVRVLERHERIVRLAVIAVCALFGARAALHVVDAMEGSSAWASEAPASEATAGAVGARRTRGEVAEVPGAAAIGAAGAAMAERNIFCSSCAPPPPPSSQDAAPTGVPPLTALPLRLIATHTSSAGGSSATVLDGASANQGAYGMGERLPGAGPIVRIGGRSIDFENPAAGRVERLAIADPAAAPSPAPPAAEGEPSPERPAGRGADPELAAALDAGVRAVDETTFEVDRGLIESVIARPQAAARGARVSPQSGGGLRLVGVRPSSAHARLGLRSGDLILAVNGIDLSSPDKMLEAVTRLRSESTVSLSITRRRQPVTLTYHIR